MSTPEPNPANPREPESPLAQFRERKMSELRAEREPQGPTPPALKSQEDAPVEDEDLRARQPEADSDQEQESLLTEAEDNDGAEAETPEEESEPEEGSLEWYQAQTEELQTKAEKAEELRSSMERDYRVKTANIAQKTRELTEHVAEVETQATFLVQEADKELQQFDRVDWSALQQDPAKYQQAQQAWKKAMQQRDHRVGQLQQIQQQFRGRVEEARRAEAVMSRDVLKATIPDWDNNRLDGIRDYAVNKLGFYSEQQFDDITDWRIITLIDQAERSSRAPAQLSKPSIRPKSRPPKRPAGRANRNQKGQFQNAQKAMMENPGDRRAQRSFFEQKLKAERDSRG